MDIQEFYEKYFSIVYKYLLSLSQNQHIAEEITQETFFKAMQKINQFDGSCNIRTWLCQIGKNTYFDYLRKHKRLSNLEEEQELISDQNVELDYERAENIRLLHRTLHNLPEPYKEVFSLRTFGELPFKEISELFGKSESWSKMTYLRAKKKIQEEIEHERDKL